MKANFFKTAGWRAPLLVSAAGVAIGSWHFGSFHSMVAALRGEDLVVRLSQGDFGRLHVGSTTQGSIRLQNLSDRQISLLGVKFDCKCVSLNDYPSVLDPRSETIIPFAIKAEGSGRKRLTFTIFSSGGKPPEIKGNVRYIVTSQ